MLETTKNKSKEEGDTNSTIADIKSNIGRNKSGGIKNTTSNNTPTTSKHGTLEDNSDNEFIVPIGSKWSALSEQLAKITSNFIANYVPEKPAEAKEIMDSVPVLREEDMDMYGVTPGIDKVTLVVCSLCSKLVINSSFPSHYSLCQSLKDLPTEDTKRKAAETLSRPPKKPQHDLPTSRSTSNSASAATNISNSNSSHSSNSSKNADRLKSKAPKPVRPQLLRTADGRFAPMNRLNGKNKKSKIRKKVEAPTTSPDASDDESNAPRTPEYDREDDATVPDSPTSPLSPSLSLSSPPPSSPSLSSSIASISSPLSPVSPCIPTPPPPPEWTQRIPTPLATRNYTRPNKLRKILVSLVPNSLFHQKLLQQPLCTIYHEQPINHYPRSNGSLYNSPGFLKEEKTDVNYNLPGGNFLSKASSDKLLNSPNLGKTKKVLKKKPENGVLPGSLTGSLNGQESFQGVPASPVPPMSPNLGRSQNLGLSQNLNQSQNLLQQGQSTNVGQSPNLGQSGTQVKIYKSNSQTNLHNSVNLQIGPSTTGQEMSPNMFPLQPGSKVAGTTTGSLKSFYKGHESPAMATTQANGTPIQPQQQSLLLQQMQQQNQLLPNPSATTAGSPHPSVPPLAQPAGVRKAGQQTRQLQPQQQQQQQQQLQQQQNTQNAAQQQQNTTSTAANITNTTNTTNTTTTNTNTTNTANTANTNTTNTTNTNTTQQKKAVQSRRKPSSQA